MSATEIIAELAKLEQKDLERVDAQLHQLLANASADAVSDETHVGLEDFPQFPTLRLMQEYLGRDVIYDARGR